MFINEYGDKNNPLVLLLAPMMVSGEDLYQLMHPFFLHEYHYIAPDQGGHGKAGAYISADEEYKTLKSFLLDEGYREIELVYGASLGVAIGFFKAMRSVCHLKTKVSMPSPATMYITIFQDMINRSFFWRPCGY